MRLPRLAIENHQFAGIVVMLLTALGLVSLLTMPRSEDPQIQEAAATIIAVLPGADPVDIEELVADPLEEALNELEDVERIDTSIEDGILELAIEFSADQDPDDVHDAVIEQVNRIRGDLPAELHELTIFEHDTGHTNVLQVAIVSDSAAYATLQRLAEKLETRLERVAGIRKVETWAYPEQEVRIAVDLALLAQRGIALSRIMGAIQAAGANIPGGTLDIGTRRYNIQTSGPFDSLDDIRRLVVATGGGKVLYLADVAEVRFAYADRTHLGRVNGRRAVFVTAPQKEGSNIFDVMDGVQRELAAFRDDLPAGVDVQVVHDQSESVANRVSGFLVNLVQGVILVGLVVFLAMSIRAALIVMLVIPVSILIGLGFVDLSGFALEQMSIAGLVIALGLLVDNAIVVTENVSRFLRQGHSRTEAAVQGTSQIGWAVVSSTATTVLAFLPMVLMQSVTGSFIRSMPVTVIFTLSASLLLSLTLTPWLASRFLRSRPVDKGAARLIQTVIDTRYRTRLRQALARPAVVLLAASGVFLGSLALFPVVGISFFPKSEKPLFLVNVDAPTGTSLAATDSLVRFVEGVLAERDEVKTVTTNVGRGNPRIYYNAIPKRARSSHGQLLVELNGYDHAAFETTLAELRTRLSGIPGARIEVKEFVQGPPFEAPIAIKLIGENLEVLRRLSREVESLIGATAGTVNINNPLATPKTDLKVAIDRDKAAMWGIPLVEIDRTVRAGMTGMPVGQYRDPDGEAYDIVVRLPIDASGGTRLSDFDRIYLPAATGRQVPLAQLADLTFKSGPLMINHFNLERSVTLTADVAGSASVDAATRAIIAGLEKMEWPRGYRFYVGGEFESRQESFAGMYKAVLVALLAIFGVLVLQFRSYRQPLIVFAAIPLAVIGSILALLITGNSFSFTAFVGLTSLVGIVINNSIILVDYTNRLRREGRSLVEALQEACETRFTPILLTTATTIGGLLPLTLGGGTMWAPMGWTIIGGLLASTVLTLLVVPVLYRLFSRENASAA